MQKPRKHIVILGAGVAGIRFVLDFEPKVKNFDDVKITMLDQFDYHQYIHKLHEVAGGRTEPKDIAIPIEWIIRNKKIEFFQAKVKSIDVEKKTVRTDKRTIQYDILVVALGSQTCYYGIKGLEENSLGMKSIEEAYIIRKRVEEIFASTKDRKKPLTFMIGGGGFTGVELAGEFAEWFPRLAEKYEITPQNIRLIMVEALETVLPNWDPKVIEHSMKILRNKGVELMLGQTIAGADDGGLTLKNGERINVDLSIWTGGIEGVLLCPSLDYGKSRRVLISNICAAINFPNVYVIGDLSYLSDASTKKSIAPNAHVAMEQASFLAKNLYAHLVGKSQNNFIPKHVGEVVSIGREDAVGRLWGIELKGWIGKIAKRMIHLGYVYTIGGVRLLLKGKRLGELTEWGKKNKE